MKDGEMFSVFMKSGRGTLIPPHFHSDAMEFLEVVRGSADVTVGLRTTRVAEGEILHLLPNLVHFATSVGEGECVVRVLSYRLSAVTVNDELDRQILSLYILPVENLSVLFGVEHPLHGTLASHMEAAIAEWYGKEIFHTALILAEISHMLAAVLRFYGYREEDGDAYRNRMRIAPVVHYIEASYTQKLRLEDLAAPLYLSPDHFGKLFKTTVGLTPVEYVNLVRINAAMRLLSATDAPIAEISAHSGFSNPNYFHKVFHDLVGVGPAALRKRWRAMQKETCD